MITSILKGIFTPAVALMGRLRYWQKFIVITILFTIPLGYIFFSFILQTNKSLVVTEKETIGVQYVSPVLSFLQHVQQHRGAASLYRRGEQSFKTLLDEKVQSINEDIARVDVEDRKSGVVLQSTDKWHTIKKEWFALEGEYTTLSPEESFIQHTELISRILVFIHELGDNSGLVLDSEIQSYGMMSAVVSSIPFITEQMGQARAFGLSVKDPKDLSDVERKEFINYAKIVSIENVKMQDHLHHIYENDLGLKTILAGPSTETDAEIKNFIDIMNNIINSRKISVSLPEYYALTTNIIDIQFSFSTRLVSHLEKYLENRTAMLAKKFKQSLAIIAISYLLVLYFFIGFYLLIIRTVRELENIAKQLISGRITEVPVLSNDELGEVGKSFNSIGQELIASNNDILERAQELQKKSEELEHLNKFMINREVKMSELKAEIAKLKSTSSPNQEQGR